MRLGEFTSRWVTWTGRPSRPIRSCCCIQCWMCHPTCWLPSGWLHQRRERPAAMKGLLPASSRFSNNTNTANTKLPEPASHLEAPTSNSARLVLTPFSRRVRVAHRVSLELAATLLYRFDDWRPFLSPQAVGTLPSEIHWTTRHGDWWPMWLPIGVSLTSTRYSG
jgi:hypothetical protein